MEVEPIPKSLRRGVVMAAATLAVFAGGNALAGCGDFDPNGGHARESQNYESYDSGDPANGSDCAVEALRDNPDGC